MLVASAGYDPRVSLTVNEKYRGKTMDMAPRDELLSTHPSGRTVKRFLTQTHVMEEALAVYMEKKQHHLIIG
ncbi:hypothetical protein QJS04_geneDACA011362 [Acorus gramineus]|uniref:Uncharacterized protein n=1 Tax=Acorus gramineus TaxID=55184 RepID=A0AAV9AMY8_ACOGR|nr:hypothetical protein QJS04_geneDACA011362 [Acorus gramineus]